MIASLPMYDRPETQAAHDRLWALIRANLDCDRRPVPETLSRTGTPEDHWRDSELCLSQTCGLPYRTELHDKVALVGTPIHDLPCAPGFYYSVLVTRRDDPRDSYCAFDHATLAYNCASSQSGWAAPYAMAETFGFTYEATLETGSHQASAKAVLEGKADLAALDAVTWLLIQRFDPWAAGLKEIATTPPTPALPYISTPDHDIDNLHDALKSAIDQLLPHDQDLLCLTGLTFLSRDAYLALPIPAGP